MKNKIIGMVCTFVAAILLMPNVYAAGTKITVEKAEESEKYDTLSDAIQNVKEGGTITLEEAVDVPTTIDVTGSKSFILNLNGKTLKGVSGQRILNIKEGTVTITGRGTVDSTEAKGGIYVYGATTKGGAAGHLTIDSGVTVKGVSPIVVSSLNRKDSYGAELNVMGTVEGTSTAGVFVHGTIKNTEDPTEFPEITVSGTVKSDTEAGFAQMGGATTTITGTVEGATGIVIKSGTLNLNGATVTGKGAFGEAEPSGNGYNSTGAAIQIESNVGYAGNIDISVSGGTYTSEDNSAIVEYTDENTFAIDNIAIEGGTFQAAEGKEALSISSEEEEVFTNFISRGEFLSGSEKSDVSAYLISGVIQDENGNVVTPVEPSEDKGPDTADMNVYGLLALILLSGVGLTYVVRKRMN